MQKNAGENMYSGKRRGPKGVIVSIMSAIIVFVLTVLMALFGYHLASRYRDTITNAVNGITAKISGIENDFLSEAEMSDSDTEK